MKQMQNRITNDELIPSAHNHAKPMLAEVESCPELKVCTRCKFEFEKNNFNFFEKQSYYIIKDGTKILFKKLSAVCKKCHGKISTERNRNKRCKELNCELGEYRQKALEENSKNRTKIIEAKGIKNYPLLLRRVANGYNFTTVEQYLKDKQDNFWRGNREKRKLNYPECSKVADLPKSIINKVKSEYNNRVLPRAVIANRLRLKLSTCPNELIENQRLIIQINQILNNK